MENLTVVAVKALILHDRKVLLVKRSPNDEIGAGTWEFPGGKLDFGEKLEAGLKREVLEEAGIEIDIDRILFASAFQTHVHRQVVILNYLCFCQKQNITLSIEHTDSMWADRDSIHKYLHPDILSDLENNRVLDSIDID